MASEIVQRVRQALTVNFVIATDSGGCSAAFVASAIAASYAPPAGGIAVVDAVGHLNLRWFWGCSGRGCRC